MISRTVPAVRKTALAALYAVVLAAAYFAGVNMGGWPLRIFLALFVPPLASAALTLVTCLGCRFTQEFSTDHPQKGSEVGWRVVIANPLPIWIAPICVETHPVPGGSEDPGPGTVGTIGPRKNFEFSTNFRCAYRGVYNLGLRRILVKDLLFGYRIPLPVPNRGFYVAPQVYPLARNTATQTHSGRVAGTGSSDVSPEAANIKGLAEYQPGQPISRIHWRTVARYNKLLVAEYEGHLSRFGVFVLDTRRWRTAGPRGVGPGVRIPCEDTAVEVLFSLIGAYRENRWPWEFIVPGWSATPDRELQQLLIHSTSIFFEQDIGLRGLVEQAVAGRRAAEVFLISPFVDSQLIEAALDLERLGIPGGVYVSATGYPPDHAGLTALKNLVSGEIETSRRGSNIHILESSDEIPKKVFV